VTRLAIIGSGRVGTVLAMGLRRAGYPVVAAASRTRASAEALAARVPGCQVVEPAEAIQLSDLVLLTVSDDAITPAAASLPLEAGKAVVHCSGATSVAALQPAAELGAITGSFHPFHSFATDPDVALASLPGATFALEGEGPLLNTLRAMAEALGGTTILVPSAMKPLYHASATFAAAGVVVAMQQAVDLWAAFGVPKEQALHALLPLMRSAVTNLEQVGLPGSLTGPVARGDLGPIRQHLASLAEATPHLIPLYVELALRGVDIALAKGTIDDARANDLRQVLNDAQAPVERTIR
jgi:predicted short-subunit dehydrogenase-like oxidoreductase (DUF2520 family)